jgi:hypothetical protein
LDLDEFSVSAADLRSRDPERIRAALNANHPLPDELIPAVIGLLADDRVNQVALKALGRVAPAHTGALLDVALDSRRPPAVRGVICSILGRLPTQRSASGLILLLADKDFEIRCQAAAGLLAISRRSDRIEFPRDSIFATATIESAECRRHWNYCRALDPALADEATISSARGRRVVLGINHISTLLEVVLDREPFLLAIRAVMSGRGQSRGTGLEYLENVLPGDLLVELRPLLEDVLLARIQARFLGVFSAENLADARQNEVDLTRLREHVDSLRRQTPGA